MINPDLPDPPDSFLTLAGPAEAEIKVQRSRFVALTVPVTSVDEAQIRLQEVARRFHDARHVCFGYRLGVGAAESTRKSDDGEPSGTAGEPILVAIRKREVTDTLVTVVRYFGGIKLGTGGLARAYGQAAALALEETNVREVLLGREFLVTFPYVREKTIRRLVSENKGRLVDQQYGQDVTWRIWLPHSIWRGFSATLTEMTAGTVTLEPALDPPLT